MEAVTVEALKDKAEIDSATELVAGKTYIFRFKRVLSFEQMSRCQANLTRALEGAGIKGIVVDGDCDILELTS